MKKLLLSIAVLFLLFGCTTKELEGDKNTDDKENEVSKTNDVDSKGSASLEKQIQELMVQNDFLIEDIMDYEIKGEYIFVVALNSSKRIKEAIIKNNNGQLEWIKGMGRASFFSAQESPVITVKVSTDSNMEGVTQMNVFGEPAKK
ncbi:hypothetical protein VBD025_05620 [Virgibacillus flavescens]|uniref:hypothetical protein n=1 Tax=Virgibacillus flavescens TaxID=1611422 RepID=UPI003D3569CB